ncbi:S-adenosyl-L-methionine-dependent methyltransferase [Elaphomyces granulatus]|jgi:SAM-dependent methyltransferase
MDSKEIYAKVQEHYGLAAKGANHEYGYTVAKAFGYTGEELANTPQGANLGLSCGNPLVLAKLKEGEIVIDLGSGAGFDVFLAAKRVGPNGKVIGVDMNKEMLERAILNKEKVGAENVSFVESTITAIALADQTADCIISNCVINLVPEQEKQLVFNETFRLLKPGGRLAISDILTKKILPEEILKSMALYVGCISGASSVECYGKYLQQAGFRHVLITDNNHDLNVYSDTRKDGKNNNPCCGPETDKIPSSCDGNTGGVDSSKTCSSGPKAINFNEWAGSYQIYAVKTSD